MPGVRALRAWILRQRTQIPRVDQKEKIYPYRIQIKSSGIDPQPLHAELVTRGLIPYWIVPSVFVFCLLFFIATSLLISGVKKVQSLELAKTEVARKTATAFFIQTYDADLDGLTNQKEAELGTNPDQPDTDGDGLWDSDEIKRQSNPLNPDTDGDQLSDGEEIEHGTQVKNADSDYDHIIDGVEVDNGTSPTNQDTDSDGIIDNLDLTPQRARSRRKRQRERAQR